VKYLLIGAAASAALVIASSYYVLARGWDFILDSA
jgi:hypothetical protein